MYWQHTSIICHIVKTQANNELAPSGRDDAWYRQPILWLGAAIFTASLAGCAWMIMLALQNPDTVTQTPEHSVLGVPTHAPAASHSASP